MKDLEEIEDSWYRDREEYSERNSLFVSQTVFAEDVK